MKAILNTYLKDLDTIPKEYLDEAYKFITTYCEERKLEVTKFVKDVKNVTVVGQAIHTSLSWMVRKIIKEEDIIEKLTEHHQWVKTKFLEIHKENKTKSKVKVKVSS